MSDKVSRQDAGWFAVGFFGAALLRKWCASEKINWGKYKVKKDDQGNSTCGWENNGKESYYYRMNSKERTVTQSSLLYDTTKTYYDECRALFSVDARQTHCNRSGVSVGQPIMEEEVRYSLAIQNARSTTNHDFLRMDDQSVAHLKSSVRTRLSWPTYLTFGLVGVATSFAARALQKAK